MSIDLSERPFKTKYYGQKKIDLRDKKKIDLRDIKYKLISEIY